MAKLYWSKPDAALLLLRVAFSLMMMNHGWQKIQNFTQYSTQFPDPFGIGPVASLSLAIFAEFFCSLLLIAGVLTPLALGALAITMLVAVFYAHRNDPWSDKEHAVSYLVVYLTLLVSGPGRYSLDRLLFLKDEKPR